MGGPEGHPALLLLLLVVVVGTPQRSSSPPPAPRPCNSKPLRTSAPAPSTAAPQQLCPAAPCSPRFPPAGTAAYVLAGTYSKQLLRGEAGLESAGVEPWQVRGWSAAAQPGARGTWCLARWPWACGLHGAGGPAWCWCLGSAWRQAGLARDSQGVGGVGAMCCALSSSPVPLLFFPRRACWCPARLNSPTSPADVPWPPYHSSRRCRQPSPCPWPCHLADRPGSSDLCPGGLVHRRPGKDCSGGGAGGTHPLECG